VRVTDLHERLIVDELSAHGYRRRPEPWNNIEQTRSGPERKLVFAPPVGDRRTNIHVRVSHGRGAHDALLFRDFLREEPTMRDAWGRFKQAVAGEDQRIDLVRYGQIKAPAWTVLMYAADRWAHDHNWIPSSAYPAGDP
jgi:dephospho-CoA kinase